MQRIRDSNTIIGLLENGELAQRLTNEMMDTLAALQEHTGGRPKVKAKGSVTLKLNIEVVDGTVTIEAETSSKRPKPVHGSSFYWLLDDGSLSTQHPKQIDMFGGPRDASRGITDVIHG
ncbi:hypothetical protein BG46_10810 [Brucella anthropi]|uniref:hypothetical protein n=1 Tax=Brucella anthropi TaxID=529 RepID=UPI0004476A00|nr:hypothetical protein [Brucella anthropi]EXL07397.1 hypothetical protein BG46_10810 [Brucella anthropi]RRY13363.1 hypothetical protein EGJ58_03425 [Brucella anthropi]